MIERRPVIKPERKRNPAPITDEQAFLNASMKPVDLITPGERRGSAIRIAQALIDYHIRTSAIQRRKNKE